MAYGRETIMGGLRKAGQALKDFDEDYAHKVSRAVGGDRSSTPRVMLGSILGSPATIKPIELDPGETRDMITPGIRALQVGAPIVSGTVRYGLPAAGVTAAGLGIAELASVLGQQTNDTLIPGNNYNYIENVPKERTFNGSSEGEMLVAGMRGFGEYKDYDPVILGSRVNDLQEQMGYMPVRASGYYSGGVMPED